MLFVNTSIKKILYLFLPPIIFSIFKNRKIRYKYRTYERALEKKYVHHYLSGNVDLDAKIKTMITSTDYDKIWCWTTLSGVLFSYKNYISTKSSGMFNIYDYGGGYAETYFQIRNFTNHMNLKWNVIELVEKVNECNKLKQKYENLQFYTVGNFKKMDDNIECLLLGGVLQLLEDPLNVIKELLLKNPKVVLIDRTPMIKEINEKYIYYIHKERKVCGDVSQHPYCIINYHKMSDIFHLNNYINIGQHIYSPHPRPYSKANYYAQIWTKE
jgi:putative methyltransferase (TIGR04325 family)